MHGNVGVVGLEVLSFSFLCHQENRDYPTFKILSFAKEKKRSTRRFCLRGKTKHASLSRIICCFLQYWSHSSQVHSEYVE